MLMGAGLMSGVQLVLNVPDSHNRFDKTCFSNDPFVLPIVVLGLYVSVVMVTSYSCKYGKSLVIGTCLDPRNSPMYGGVPVRGDCCHS